MNRCIVVVEDDRGISTMLTDLLKQQRFDVVAVTEPDVVDAVAAEANPDLFLIDVMLTGISGIEVAQNLREQGFTHTPMIGMSASKVMAKFAFESGAFDDTMEKPFEISALLDRIERYAA